MITLTLIRHAATALNDDGRYQGRCDPDLSEPGVSQAKGLGRRIAKESAVFDSVWASDRHRALCTAVLALPRAIVRQDARLRELDFGVFDGLTYEENLSRHTNVFLAWLADPWHVRPPSGETLAELTARVEAWVGQLASSQNVLAFTHGGPIRVILARSIGLSFVEAQRLPVGPCGLVRVRLNASGALVTLSRAPEERSWP